jgi:acetyl esterase/lipase
VVVGLHGGAYVREIALPHWLSYARLVRTTGARVVVPIYPLAPRGTAGLVVPQVADLLAALVHEHGATAVGVLGDSAGGGLAMAAVQELVRRGEPTPARLVLISPWLDVTMTDPAAREVDDPMLDPDSLEDCGRLWAGDLDTADPRVSPLFGSLEGLPPTRVYAGTRDVLYPDALRLHERAQQQGAPVTVDLRRDLVHVWAGIPVLPETRAVQPEIVRALVGDRA